MSRLMQDNMSDVPHPRRAEKRQPRNVVKIVTKLTLRERNAKLANIRSLEMFQVQAIWEISVNGKLRDELLNGEMFLSIAEARWVIDRWRLDYNHHRLDRILDYQTPAAFAARCPSSVRPTASLQKNTGSMNPDSLT
jgi:transposase InsO family protein